jgi:hypothetical protein
MNDHGTGRMIGSHVRQARNRTLDLLLKLDPYAAVSSTTFTVKKSRRNCCQQKTWREKVKQNFLPNACTPFEQHERQ